MRFKGEYFHFKKYWLKNGTRIFFHIYFRKIKMCAGIFSSLFAAGACPTQDMRWVINHLHNTRSSILFRVRKKNTSFSIFKIVFFWVERRTILRVCLCLCWSNFEMWNTQTSIGRWNVNLYNTKIEKFKQQQGITADSIRNIWSESVVQVWCD